MRKPCLLVNKKKQNMNFTLYLKRFLENECPSYQEVNPENIVFIPRNYSEEEESQAPDIELLKKRFPEVVESFETGKPLTLELSLAEISTIIPKKRIRVDAYARLQRLLKTKNIELKIFSQKTKAN
jgi:hypothetical protein